MNVFDLLATNVFATLCQRQTNTPNRSPSRRSLSKSLCEPKFVFLTLLLCLTALLLLLFLFACFSGSHSSRLFLVRWNSAPVLCSPSPVSALACGLYKQASENNLFEDKNGCACKKKTSLLFRTDRTSSGNKQSACSNGRHGHTRTLRLCALVCSIGPR